MTRLLNIVSGINRNSTIIAKKAIGCWLTDIHDKKYLDMTAAIGALSTGHCHPKVVDSVKTQVSNLVIAQQNCVLTYESQQLLIDKLNKITPKHIDTYYFTNSGSEAVENAIKLARISTGKANIISFIGGFHGRTLGCMSLNASKVNNRKGFAPLLSGIFNLRYPVDGLGEEVYKDLEDMLLRITDPDETAAIIMEPILGEGGLFRADPIFVKKMRKLCDKHNFLWISDEVQTGICRTGNWWGYQHFGVEPDIITFGKGISSGFQLAGVASTKKNFDYMHENGIGGTYNGHVISTVAANSTLEVIEAENLLENVNILGSYFKERLENMHHPLIEEIRVYGLMIAIKLNLNNEAFSKCIKEAETHGIMILTTGIDNTIRLLPPLIITIEEIEIFIDKFTKLLDSQIVKIN